MKKWFRRILITAVAAGMMLTAAYAGDWKPIEIAPAEGYYLVKEVVTSWWDGGTSNIEDTSTYSYEFDADGNMLQKKTVYPDGSEIVDTYFYDANGDCTKLVTGGESETRYTYDSSRNLIRMESWGCTTTYSYNSAGQLTEEKVAYDYMGDYTEDAVYTYAANGTLSSVVRTITGELGNSIETTNYTYDNSGKLTSERTKIEDERVHGSGYDYYYDSQGRLSKFIEYVLNETDYTTYDAGDTVVYEYDAQGNNTKITVLSWGETEEGHTYEYTYERLGPPTTPKDCDGDESCPGHDYSDLDSSAWYHAAVDYVLETGLMQGYPDKSFHPTGELTRAELVQILYNKEGHPAVSGQDNFTDTDPGTWYSDPVLWATQNGLVEGYGNGCFGPSDSITREQMVTILYRYAKFKGCDVSASGDLFDYKDADQVSEYAEVPFQWSVSNGIIEGMPGNILASRNNTNRAQVAAVIMRFCLNVE